MRQSQSNPISIVVPCHRVIGRNGTMTGYAGGVQQKSGYCAMKVIFCYKH
ncbi:methylated-DNA--[protein]-cysteine S-methyltransferase [Escherichia coli]